MSVVRRRDHKGVNVSLVEHRTMVGVQRDVVAGDFTGALAGCGHGVGNRDHLNAPVNRREELEIADVLNTHQAGAKPSLIRSYTSTE